jgi:hypothetical protein
VNPLGEHRLQGSRIATIIASSSMERTVDLACQVQGKSCRSEQEWRELAKPFFEE